MMFSENPTDPSFLGPTLYFSETSEIHFEGILHDFHAFSKENNSLKKFAYLPTLKNIQMFLETRQLSFLALLTKEYALKVLLVNCSQEACLH